MASVFILGIKLVTNPFYCMLLFSEGRRHDFGLFREYGLLDDLERYSYSSAREPLCLYGDPAHQLRLDLQAPFRDVALTPQMQQFNEIISTIKVSVEWLFAVIYNDVKFIDFKKGLKIGISSVGKMYVACILLRNALTCLYGNITSMLFNLDPPAVRGPKRLRFLGHRNTFQSRTRNVVYSMI